MEGYNKWRNRSPRCCRAAPDGEHPCWEGDPWAADELHGAKVCCGSEFVKIKEMSQQERYPLGSQPRTEERMGYLKVVLEVGDGTLLGETGLQAEAPTKIGFPTSAFSPWKGEILIGDKEGC